MRPIAVPGSRPALIVAHPGHELRVHGWLESVRPRVFVLTDGSGRSGQSRLGSTTHVLARVGAERGSIYGRLTDLELYEAILDHNIDLFFKLAEELAEELVRYQVEYVAGDAAEGYNPAHDVCRLLVNAAVEMAHRRKGHRIDNFDLLLIGQPDQGLDDPGPPAILLALSEDAFSRKRMAALECPELAGEVANAITRTGIEAFRVECLRPVGRWTGSYILAESPPFYERYGEKRAAAGYYKRVIRYREHVLPLAEALWRHVEMRRR